jgi:hypothetical protein
MLGDVAFHHSVTGETEFTITSPELIESNKRRKEWNSNLAKRYEISDNYIDKEHEEKNTGPVDISLYVKDHPENEDEILKEDRFLTEERSRLEHEAERGFIKNLGISTPEGKTLLGVYVCMNIK